LILCFGVAVATIASLT